MRNKDLTITILHIFLTYKRDQSSITNVCLTQFFKYNDAIPPFLHTFLFFAHLCLFVKKSFVIFLQLSSMLNISYTVFIFIFIKYSEKRLRFCNKNR